ncbi:MAG: hypothetical protein AB7V04_14155, partial [Desulfomonilaceae bacterium]
MRLLKYALAIVILVSPVILGCGSGTKSGSVNEEPQKLISELRGELDKARSELENQTDLNKSLDDQVQFLKARLDEIEKESSDDHAATSHSSESSGTFDSQSRVALMGAKALAEFKAEQLSSKLEKLTQLVQTKETELSKILEKSESLT